MSNTEEVDEQDLDEDGGDAETIMRAKFSLVGYDKTSRASSWAGNNASKGI